MNGYKRCLGLLATAVVISSGCGGPEQTGAGTEGKGDSVYSHKLDLRLREPARQLEVTGQDVGTTATVLEVGERSVTIETDQLVFELPPDQAVSIELPRPWTQGVFAANRAFQVDRAEGDQWRPHLDHYMKNVRLYANGAATGDGVYFTGRQGPFLGEDEASMIQVIHMGTITLGDAEASAPSQRYRVKTFPIAKWGDWIAGAEFGTTVRLAYECYQGQITITNSGDRPTTLTHAKLAGDFDCEDCVRLQMLGSNWYDLDDVTVEPGQRMTLQVGASITQLYFDDGNASIYGDNVHAVRLRATPTGCVDEVALD